MIKYAIDDYFDDKKEEVDQDEKEGGVSEK